MHNFVPVYEMEWSVRFVASDLSTLERRDLVKKRFPHLVDEFQKSLEADKKKKKPKGRIVDILCTRIEQLLPDGNILFAVHCAVSGSNFQVLQKTV